MYGDWGSLEALGGSVDAIHRINDHLSVKPSWVNPYHGLLLSTSGEAEPHTHQRRDPLDLRRGERRHQPLHHGGDRVIPGVHRRLDPAADPMSTRPSPRGTFSQPGRSPVSSPGSLPDSGPPGSVVRNASTSVESSTSQLHSVLALRKRYALPQVSATSPAAAPRSGGGEHSSSSAVGARSESRAHSRDPEHRYEVQPPQWHRLPNDEFHSAQRYAPSDAAGVESPRAVDNGQWGSRHPGVLARNQELRDNRAGGTWLDPSALRAFPTRLHSPSAADRGGVMFVGASRTSEFYHEPPEISVESNQNGNEPGDFRSALELNSYGPGPNSRSFQSTSAMGMAGPPHSGTSGHFYPLQLCSMPLPVKSSSPQVGRVGERRCHSSSGSSSSRDAGHVRNGLLLSRILRNASIGPHHGGTGNTQRPAAGAVASTTSREAVRQTKPAAQPRICCLCGSMCPSTERNGPHDFFTWQPVLQHGADRALTLCSVCGDAVAGADSGACNLQPNGGALSPTDEAVVRSIVSNSSISPTFLKCSVMYIRWIHAYSTLLVELEGIVSALVDADSTRARSPPPGLQYQRWRGSSSSSSAELSQEFQKALQAARVKQGDSTNVQHLRRDLHFSCVHPVLRLGMLHAMMNCIEETLQCDAHEHHREVHYRFHRRLPSQQQRALRGAVREASTAPATILLPWALTLREREMLTSEHDHLRAISEQIRTEDALLLVTEERPDHSVTHKVNGTQRRGGGAPSVSRLTPADFAENGLVQSHRVDDRSFSSSDNALSRVLSGAFDAYRTAHPRPQVHFVPSNQNEGQLAEPTGEKYHKYDRVAAPVANSGSGGSGSPVGEIATLCEVDAPAVEWEAVQRAHARLTDGEDRPPADPDSILLSYFEGRLRDLPRFAIPRYLPSKATAAAVFLALRGGLPETTHVSATSDADATAPLLEQEHANRKALAAGYLEREPQSRLHHGNETGIACAQANDDSCLSNQPPASIPSTNYPNHVATQLTSASAGLADPRATPLPDLLSRSTSDQLTAVSSCSPLPTVDRMGGSVRNDALTSCSPREVLANRQPLGTHDRHDVATLIQAEDLPYAHAAVLEALIAQERMADEQHRREEAEDALRHSNGRVRDLETLTASLAGDQLTSCLSKLIFDALEKERNVLNTISSFWLDASLQKNMHFTEAVCASTRSTERTYLLQRVGLIPAVNPTPTAPEPLRDQGNGSHFSPTAASIGAQVPRFDTETTVF